MTRKAWFAAALTLAGVALTSADASAQFRNRGGRGNMNGNARPNNGITIPGTNYTIPGTFNSNNLNNGYYGNSGYQNDYGPRSGQFSNNGQFNNGRYSNNGQYYTAPGSTTMPQMYGSTMPITPAGYSSPSDSSQVARVMVQLPAQDAELWVNDSALTTTRGMDREFQSPPLDPAKNYTYTVKTRWTVDGKTMEKSRDVKVEPGKTATVSFR